MEEKNYLEYLAELYPTIEKVSTEIINLPKGIEHFLSDVHGEYEAFSHGMTLAAHEPFETAEAVIQEEKDIVSHQITVNHCHKRQTVGDMDNGKQLTKKIAELKELIRAYRSGTIKERGN